MTSSEHRGWALTPAKSLLLAAVLLLAGAAALCLNSLTPSILAVVLQAAGNTYRAHSLPLRFSEQGITASGRIRLEFGPLLPSYLLIEADDCLDALWVNDAQYPGTPLCAYPFGAAVNVRGLLHSGENTVRFALRNAGGDGRLNVSAAPDDPAVSAVRIILSAAFGWAAALLIRGGAFLGTRRIFAAGCALRLFYFLATPAWVRAYDWEGHLYYMRYLHDNLSLPSLHLGWQTHHPPLYHILGALWLGAVRMTAGGSTTVTFGLQCLALFSSIFVLWAACRTAAAVFERPLDRAAFSALIAAHPGLIYFAARINNDVLVLPLLAAAFLVLIRWWQAPSPSRLYASSLILILAACTKATGLVLNSAALLLFVLKEGRGKEKARRVLLLAVSVLAFLSLTVFRMKENGPLLTSDMRGSVDLRIGNGVSALAFSPAAMLREPLINPRDDKTGRERLWEYLFRTAYFGEFRYPSSLKTLQRALLLSGFTVLLLALLGLLSGSRCEETVAGGSPSVPFAATTGVVLAACFAARFLIPYAPIQDFRYVALIAFPWAYFTVLGVHAFSGARASAARLAAVLHALLCAGFVIAVCLTPPAFDF